MRLTGIFDEFSDLDKITPEDVIRWLKPKPDYLYVENLLANRIYYPQVVPLTRQELIVDLAILREALIKNPKFLKKSAKRLIIPERFIARFPNLNELAKAFMDSYKITGPLEIVLEK